MQHAPSRWCAILLASAAGACSQDPAPSGSPDALPRLPDPPQPSAARVVFVAGGPSHGPGEHEYRAGAILLSRMLDQTSSVTSTVVTGGWPDDRSVFEGAAAIVFLTDGNEGHPLVAGDRLDQLAPYLARRTGFAAIHWSVHFPERTSARILEILGGHYLDGVSVNPHWTARFEALPDHPITRGVGPFERLDEWYYNLRFTGGPGLTPLLWAVPPDDTRFTADAAMHPGRAEVVSWAFERADGGRSFGLTGAHFHQSWGEANFRRIAVNGILWIAGREVPAEGAPVELDPAFLAENLDPK